MTSRRLADQGARWVLVVCAALFSAPGRPALAGGPTARQIVLQMRGRGAAPGEIRLALAAHYARKRDAKHALSHLRAARKAGVSPGRVDLLLGELYRRVGRYDAAFSTLVRVLVDSPEQPHALVQLWKTLYESKLRGAEVKSDVESIRKRLASSGLYFPARFKLDSDADTRSRKLAASGYTALLGGRNQFAAELFQAAIAAMPSNARAHRGLGIARARLHDFMRAAGAYLLYLQLAPNARDADRVDATLMRYWRKRYHGPPATTSGP